MNFIERRGMIRFLGLQAHRCPAAELGHSATEGFGVEIHYLEHAFGFEPTPGEEFTGQLVLDDGQRALLVALSAAEDECWYLDDDGERRPAEDLFARSPWSCPGPAGPIKLLCRWLDLRDGSAHFNTPELYGGDLFRWMRPGG